MSTNSAVSSSPKSFTDIFIMAALLALAVLGFLFWGGLVEMEWRWSISDEYSHGYMIPLVALFLLWQKLPALRELDWQPTKLAIVTMAAALCGWLLGELSSLFIIVHYSFILALISLALAVYGWSGFKLTWAAFAYLIFMIPLPVFLYQGLSAQLQLISTVLGVAVIRLFGISVHVAGNVIDLGVYQLQVVEACSGLRYLFPLMSFGFLIAYLYRGPLWHRWVIFLSTVPITILMNSFRIGVIGVTVEYWGIEMAEGFLHDFEGWFVFMACLGVLLLEICLLNLFASKKVPVFDLLDLDYPTLNEIRNVIPGRRNTAKQLFATAAVLAIAIPISVFVTDREENIPTRSEFNTFPLIKGSWIGRESRIEDQKILDELSVTDYMLVDYRHSDTNTPVNFYIAYYESQRKGSAIHSPRSCLPGGGWKISELSQQSLDDVPGVQGLRLNRAIIQKGDHKQLVYYWFQQRGRTMTSEYLAKWYLFWDSLTMARTDGALVRLLTQMQENESVDVADTRLKDFLREFYRTIPEFIPN
ncbi:MAG: VPLPA-CTERM-specific exosortase XrtD [Pseudomonadales bacterium]